MKKPNFVFPPSESSYEEKIEEINIYSHYQKFDMCYECDSFVCQCDELFCPSCSGTCCDDFEEGCLHFCTCNKVLSYTGPINKSTDINFLSIKDLISFIPEGIPLSDIRLKTELDYSNSSGVHGFYVHCYYFKRRPADPNGFKEAEEKYKVDREKYDQDMIEYEKWKVSQAIEDKKKQISQIEAEISQLKK